MTAASPASAAGPQVTVGEIAVQASAGAEGVDAAALLSADAARAAVELLATKIAACPGAVPGKARHQVSLAISPAGAVQRVDRGTSDVPDAFARCADDALIGLSVPAFKGDAGLTLSVELVVDTPQPPPEPEAKPAAEPEAKPAAEPEAKPAAEPEAKPAAETEAKVSSASSGGAVVSAEVSSDDEEDSKPWRVSFTLSQSLSAGSFVADEFARSTSYGWAAKLLGSYKLNDMLTASLRFDASQLLTVSHQDAGTQPREFYFRETRLGLSAKNVYEEKFTGIALGLATSLRLPTDKAGQAAERLFAFTLGANLRKTFENVGPGELTLTWSSSFRQNVGPRAASLSSDEAASTFNACRSFSDAGECLQSSANTAHSFGNGLSVEYTFYEDFTFLVDFTITNAIRSRLDDSELPASLASVEVGRSPYATDAVNQSDLTWAYVEFAYQINDMFAVALGTGTVSNPFIQDGNNSTALRFPFWDFSSSATNISEVYLDLNVSY